MIIISKVKRLYVVYMSFKHFIWYETIRTVITNTIHCLTYLTFRITLPQCFDRCHAIKKVYFAGVDLAESDTLVCALWLELIAAALISQHWNRHYYIIYISYICLTR